MGLCWFRLLALVLLAWWVSHPSSYQFAVWKFLGFFWFGHLAFLCIGGGLLLFWELSEVIPRWMTSINFNYLNVYSLVDKYLFLLIKCYRFPVIRHPQGFVELEGEIQMEVEDVLRMIPARGHVPQQLSVVARFGFILFCHCNFLA